MGTRAQLSQERSRHRREQLLAAAIELFAEGGSRAITHRAVAARAGLAPATTTYYFESIQDLIRESLSSHIESWTAELETLAKIDTGTTIDLDRTDGFMASVFAARGPDVAALQISIYLAAARAPELKESADRAAAALEGFVSTLLHRAGVAEPGDLAAMIVALVSGTALRRQCGTTTEADEARMLTTAIRNVLAAHLLGPTAVSDALATLRPATP